MDKANRIFFAGNPFPAGHRIKTFVWHGQMDPEAGLKFHFHLETVDYNADDKENYLEDETLSDWQSKIVWNNYHQCTLSSTAHHQHGIMVTTPGKPFDFKAWEELTLRADQLPLAADWDPDDLSFSIYLLGHDSCADHQIQITRLPDERFNIRWTGKIALTYAGDDIFRYNFEAHLNNVGFNGIYYPKGYTQEQAMALLETLVSNPAGYVFEDLNPKSFKREYKLIYQPDDV